MQKMSSKSPLSQRSGNRSLHKEPVQALKKFGGSLVAYGQGASKLSKTLSLNGIPTSFDEARDILDNFWKAFPGLKSFMDKVVSESLETKRCRSVMDGRIRHLSGFKEFVKGHVARMTNISKNFNLQSGNASITKRAIIYVYEEIQKRNWQDSCYLICTIHDEILLTCKKEIAEETKIMLETCMKNAATHYIKNVPINCDAYIEDHWKK